MGNNLLKTILFYILPLTFSHIHVFANDQNFQCLVVSGIKKDHNNAYHGHKDFLTSGIGTKSLKDCVVFDSWKELNKHILHLEGNKKLLIVHATHGSSAKKAMCNAEDESFDYIAQSIDLISQKHKVATIMSTCYSGDLLIDKIASDEKKYLEATEEKKKEILRKLANQCVYVKSLPGYTALSDPSGGTATGENIDILSILKNEDVHGKNIEEIILKQNQGLISSAEFSGSGLANIYLKKEKLQYEDIVSISENFETYFDPNLSVNPLSCNTEKADQGIAELCIKGNLSESFISTLGVISIIGKSYEIVPFINYNSSFIEQKCDRFGIKKEVVKTSSNV